jgi:rhodanese-related sulfurtransferase
MTTADKTAQFRGTAVDVVIDVRSHLEYWLGHLPGALCIPAGDLPNALAKRADITTASRILVYCASGVRSASAAAALTSAGYRNVLDGGGMAAASEHFTPASA